MGRPPDYRRTMGVLLRTAGLLAVVLTVQNCPGQVGTTGGYRRSPPLKPVLRPTGDPRLAGFDSATRMLIETELRSASPAEREQWLTLLATVQADQVPYLLSARRQASTTGPAAAPAATEARRLETTAAPPRAPVAAVTHTAAMTTTPEPVAPESPSPTVEYATPAESTPSPGAPTEPAAAPPQRRWMTPLRGRWGDARQDAAAVAVPAIEPAAAVETEPEPSPPAARSSAYMNVELQRVMTLLRTEIEEAQKSGLPAGDPQHRRLQIQMRLLQLLADEPAAAVQAIPGLPAAEQEFWIQQLLALANELSAIEESADPARLQRTSGLLEEAQRQLQRVAPLVVEHACFCHRINSFGSYDRFAGDDFLPGQPLLLYAEVRHFATEPVPQFGYRTRLRTSLQIYPVGPEGEPSPSALPVDRRDFPATEDLCRTVRRDYFHSYRIDLPTHLPGGRYVLRLTLTDELSGKSGSVDVPFTIRAGT